MGFEKYTRESFGTVDEVIKEGVPNELVPLALKIDEVVEEVSNGRCRRRSSGLGVTYYPAKSGDGSAFLHTHPDKYQTYLYLYFDPSSKNCIDASPIPKSKVLWTETSQLDSYRWKLKIESPQEIQKQVREIIQLSYQQVTS